MYSQEDAEFVAACMPFDPKYPEIQISQTLFRLRVLEGWQIPKGSRVLEIGCGQGDMTAALAHVVGNDGRITAVDSAPEEYGGPVTVGDSAKFLKASALGDRIDFRFNFNLLDPSISFPEDSFDYAVLAHSSWYFDSLEQLGAILTRVRPSAHRLCISEWDPAPKRLDQAAHMLAVLIQGQIESYKAAGSGNVRTPYTRERLKPIIESSGWRSVRELDVDSSSLADAGWEIDNALCCALQDARNLKLSEKHLALLTSQIDILKSLAARGDYRSLGSYSIMAERIEGK